MDDDGVVTACGRSRVRGIENGRDGGGLEDIEDDVDCLGFVQRHNSDLVSSTS
jgi:hypothetical protein